MVTLEAGKIVAESLGEVQEMIDICDFAVGLSRQLYGLTIASERPDHRMMEQWHPLGPGAGDQRLQFPGRGMGVERRAGAGLRQSGDLEAEREDAAVRGSGDEAGGRALARFGDAPEGLVQLSRAGATSGRRWSTIRAIALVSATGSTAMGAMSARVSRSGSAGCCSSLAATMRRSSPVGGPGPCGAGDPVLRRRDGGSALHDAAAADRP